MTEDHEKAYMERTGGGPFVGFALILMALFAIGIVFYVEGDARAHETTTAAQDVRGASQDIAGASRDMSRSR